MDKADPEVEKRLLEEVRSLHKRLEGVNVALAKADLGQLTTQGALQLLTNNRAVLQEVVRLVRHSDKSPEHSQRTLEKIEKLLSKTTI